MSKSKRVSALDLDRYMAVKPADEQGIEFHAPFEAGFRLAGNAFQSELGTRFRRLPSTPVINPRVEELAWYTAGFQLAFRSDSRRIVVKAKLRNGEIMHHMPQTGSSSFDLYVGGPGQWRVRGSAAFPLHATEFSTELFNRPEPAVREYLLHFPLYNGVESLWIGLETGARILPPSPWSHRRPLVVYGTSITQGGCASRPGLSWTNLLSRWHNREIFNFGFSGNGRGEPEMAEILARIPDPAGFVLDYEANAHAEGIRSTLENFIGILRKHHPDVPITVISLLPPGSAGFSRGCSERIAEVFPLMAQSRDFQYELLDRLRATGDEKLFFIDGTQLLGNDWDECMMDGCHLNDLGFYRMAEALAKRLLM